MVTLPTADVWATERRVGKHRVRQLLVPAGALDVDAEEATSAHGTWPVTADEDPAGALSVVYRGRRTQQANWTGSRAAVEAATVLASWSDAFTYRPADGPRALRAPQLGAVHAAQAHWLSRESGPGLIVMPTGTGKTDTMLALTVIEGVRNLLVLVPTTALREQIADKFLRLGVLQELSILGPEVLRPGVVELEHGISDPDESRELLQHAQVIVGTPAALAACTADAKAALLARCSHLFVDEAHHVAADTWASAVKAFDGRKVLLFTATPHRRDRRGLPGRQIFRYSLAEAQRAGYYRQIDYSAIVSLSPDDGRLAAAALARLREDLNAGRDHILMARVGSIPRTAEVVAEYERLAPELKPVVIHSQLGLRPKRLVLEQLRSRDSRVIVCVDMLGEGFDLPQLKVLALHDKRHSLSPMIQLIGRFTRVSHTDDTLGTAAVFAQLDAAAAMSPLRDLFREDADWNLIVRDVSQRLTHAAAATSEFTTSFQGAPGTLPTEALRPKLSAIAYRSTLDRWDPEAARTLYAEAGSEVSPLVVGDGGATAWFFVTRVGEVEWADESQLAATTHELILMRFDAQYRLLYIHGSGKTSDYRELAAAVLGIDEPDGFGGAGQHAYKVLDGVLYPVPTNVGVTDLHGEATRFSMHTGPDVSSALDLERTGTKSQTHIAIRGHEEGEAVSISAARSGRFWTPRTAESVHRWTEWCDHQGTKLLDPNINVADLLTGFVIPEAVTDLPDAPLVAVEWPIIAYTGVASLPDLRLGDHTFDLHDTQIEAVRNAMNPDALTFSVSIDQDSAQYEATVVGSRLSIACTSAEDIRVIPRRADEMSLADWLNRNRPVYVFADDGIINDHRELLRPRNIAPFDPTRLTVLPWSGVNLRKESQGHSRDQDSIQYSTAQHLQTTHTFDVLLDDDGTGEIADLVGLRVSEDALHVTLVHCKFSTDDGPGARLEDIYEVFGQAVRSARWRRNTPGMLRRLSHRAEDAVARGKQPYELGNEAALMALLQQAPQLRPKFEVIVAQPGISQAALREDQLPVLASAAYHVRAVAGAPLNVWVSA